MRLVAGEHVTRQPPHRLTALRARARGCGRRRAELSGQRERRGRGAKRLDIDPVEPPSHQSILVSCFDQPRHNRTVCRRSRYPEPVLRVQLHLERVSDRRMLQHTGAPDSDRFVDIGACAQYPSRRP